MTKLYITAWSYDWDEGAAIFRTVEVAYARWHTDMNLDDTDDANPENPKPGTADWHAALVNAYEEGKWKAYSIYELDVESCTIRKMDPHADMDWNRVIELVGWEETPEEDEEDEGPDDELVTRSAPAWAWDMIDETLLKDMVSKAFSPELRKQIFEAHTAMAEASMPKTITMHRTDFDEQRDRIIEASGKGA